MSDRVWDVIIVGGGAAGLSAALVLAQARRAVLVVDAGEQRNLPHARMRGYLTRDALPPSELVRIGREEAASYGAKFLDDRVTYVRRGVNGFEIETVPGMRLQSARLLIATGLVDELPDIPGVREFWGDTVFHCPYCAGCEMNDDTVVVLGVGDGSITESHLMKQWAGRVILATNDLTHLTDDDRALLQARDIDVVDHAVTRVRSDDGLTLVLEHADGSETTCDRLLVGPQLHIRRELLDQLGVSVDDECGPDGIIVPAGDSGGTDELGVWVAGNVFDINCQVIEAAAQGLKAAIALNANLVKKELGRLKAEQVWQPTPTS